MKRHIIIRELNLSLARIKHIVKSDFHNSRDPDYIAQLRNEQAYLQATIKSIQTNTMHQLRGKNKVWADYFFAWAKAMHTDYGYEATKDGSFYAYCEGLRAVRDNALSRLEDK